MAAPNNYPIFWTGIVLGLALLPLVVVQIFNWLVVPLLMRRKQHMRINPQWEATSIDDLTPEMQQLLANVIPPFRALGFEVVVNVQGKGEATDVDSFQLLLVNRATGDTGII